MVLQPQIMVVLMVVPSQMVLKPQVVIENNGYIIKCTMTASTKQKLIAIVDISIITVHCLAFVKI
jgi:hypothetical protein